MVVKGPQDLQKEILDKKMCSACGVCVTLCARVKHNDEVKIPLAAISHGNGYLIIAGMDVKTDVAHAKTVKSNFEVVARERFELSALQKCGFW